MQIDCLQNFNFGNNNSDKDIKSFVDAYIKPYANIISVAYLLGRNKNGKVGEVWWKNPNIEEIKRKVL